MKPERRKKIRLGELLIEQKVISEATARAGAEEQKRTGRKLGRVLTDLGIVQEQQLHDVLSPAPADSVRRSQAAHARAGRRAAAARGAGAPLPRAGAAVGRARADGRHGRPDGPDRLRRTGGEDCKQPLRIALVREADCCARWTSSIAAPSRSPRIALEEVREELSEGDIDIWRSWPPTRAPPTRPSSG